MTIVRSYSINLYCDVGGDPSGANCPNSVGGDFKIYGKDEAECLQKATRLGWVVNTALELAICPRCAWLEKTS